MIIQECNISNIKTLQEYFLARKSSGSIANGNAQFKIFDSILVTMKLHGVNATEAIYLKQLASSFKIFTAEAISGADLVEKYDLPQDTADNIDDYITFISSCEDASNEDYSYALNPIASVEFDCSITIAGTSLLSLIGNKIETIFVDEKSGENIFSDTKKVIDNFTKLFISEFYGAIRVGFGNYDQLVVTMLNDKYCDKVEPNTAELVKAIIPYGGCINFIPSENEDVDFEEGIKAIKDSVYDCLDDEIILYFGLNTSFYTYFILNMYYGLDTICPSLKTELLLGNSFYLPHKINSTFSKRYSSVFQNILSYREYLITSKEYTEYYRSVFTTYNTNIKYIVRMKLPKEKIGENQTYPIFYEEELSGVIEKINSSIDIFLNTIDGIKKSNEEEN